MRMTTAAVSLAVFTVACSASASMVAGPITNAANGHVYYLLSANTWTGSEAEAVALGGHLVTINDAAENAWVVNTFAHYGGVLRPLWIGLTDRTVEGNFQWVNREALTYSNWNVLTSEPNNSGGSGYEEDYTYIVQENSGNPTLLATFWNDVPNDGYGVIPPIYGVVEIDPGTPAVPKPVLSGNQVCWPTEADVAYQAQWKPPLSKGNWVNFGPVVVGDGGRVCVSGHPKANSSRTYRVLVLD
jgi:hypothetical protein